MRFRQISTVTLSLGSVLGVLALVFASREAKTQDGNDSLGNPPSHMYVVGEKYFQKPFRLELEGRGRTTETILTVPAGKVAILEYIAAQGDTGVRDLGIRLRTLTGRRGTVRSYASVDVPILIAPVPSRIYPLTCSQAIKAYAGPGEPIVLSYMTLVQTRTQVSGFISGYLVPEQ